MSFGDNYVSLPGFGRPVGAILREGFSKGVGAIAVDGAPAKGCFISMLMSGRGRLPGPVGDGGTMKVSLNVGAFTIYSSKARCTGPGRLRGTVIGLG